MRTRVSAVLLAIALAAACDGEPVAPRAAVAPAPESTALRSSAATSDRDILISFYWATNGPNWVRSDNWLTDARLGDWYGVDTDGSGRVAELSLSGMWNDSRPAGSPEWIRHGLSGTIPAELGGLTHLRRLDLAVNELSGTIPSELGNLVNLETLNLNNNELSGAIPAELGGLANLETLDLDTNELSGAIPAELGGLADLQILHLGWNRLSGAIPPELGDPDDLETLNLPGNALSGAIPAELGGLANLTWLGLGANELSGTIPAELGDLARLDVLKLEENELSGTVPLSLLQLSTLLSFTFNDNAGLCLPEGLTAWYRALLFASGPVCPDADVLRELYDAAGGEAWTNADGWLGNRPLDEWYGVDLDSDGRVSGLDLEGNGLSGHLPSRLGDLAGLTTLRIGDNALSGRLPFSLTRAPLRELRYAGTGLCAPTGAWFQDWLAEIPQREGTVNCPAPTDREILAELYHATGGPNWERRDNWMTAAPLGEWHGVETNADGRVTGLSLSANGLDGSIPPTLGELAKLNTLILHHNSLTGSIPPTLGSLAEVEFLALAGNRLSGPVPPELGKLGNLQALVIETNQLSFIPPELGELANLRLLDIGANEIKSLPPELGKLGALQHLYANFNRIASIPAELGDLAELRILSLRGNRLTSIPPELGKLANLQGLYLSDNELTSIPAELGGLEELVELWLSKNRLTAVPEGLGGLTSLEILELASNELTSFPRELGEIRNLLWLDLSANRLADIPAGLGGVAGAGRAAARVGGLAGLVILDLSSNALSGSVPAGLFEFTGLRSLSLNGNAGLAGPLPPGLTALEGLDDLHTTGTELCAPADPALLDWLEGVTRQRVALCERDDGAAAYLTQAVQSREFPVPLVAGKPALLRVFVTAARTTGAGLPPVRATFYRDGVVTYELDIPAKPDPIPATIDESSLSKSVNAEIPGRVIQPGLEVVIEPDPEGTLDPALGVATRIPATGRMAVDVRAMPVFELTLVPFIWQQNPDYSITQVAAAMAADPEGHELFERTHQLLPVAELDVTAHAAVASPTNSGFEILHLTEMIRVVEGGRGHYLGMMAGPTIPRGLRGVAFDIGSWSSFSTLDSEVIAHEFGHNRNLFHSPCGGAAGPDRYYPYDRGSIGAWGYDASTGDLVPPSQRDFMSYCDPTWTSDYQFTNAVRYRIETESNSILVAAADAQASSSRTLLLWGGLDGEGGPYLRPAFFIDAPPTLPSTDGEWSLTGRDPGGAELFSVSFAMAEFTDTDDERAGFSFAVPVSWTGELASIALQGPGGAVNVDRDTDDPFTILRDEATGRIRGILDGPPPANPSPSPGVAAADSGLDILFSRGIPGAENERR